MIPIFRLFVFLVFCIGSRLGLTYIAKVSTQQHLQYMGIVALMISFGFAFIYTMGLRKTGIEMGGGKIWWNYLRPFHALMYGLFGICALNKCKNSWILLLIDTLVGLFAGVNEIIK
jgi:hypothetical protein